MALDFERLMERADELREFVDSEIAMAGKNRDARQRLRSVENSFDQIDIAQWAKVALVDFAIGRVKVEAMLRAQVRGIACGIVAIEDARGLVSGYAEMVAGLQRLRAN